MKRSILSVLFMAACSLAHASEDIQEKQQLQHITAVTIPSSQAIIVAPPPVVWNTDRELDGIHAMTIVGYDEFRVIPLAAWTWSKGSEKEEDSKAGK